MTSLLDVAADVVRLAESRGVEECTAIASRGAHVSLTLRDGKVEQATEATNRGLVISVMVDGRHSSHSTSDLRPEAIEHFLDRAIAATAYLERDPERRLPEPELCGRGVTADVLDQDDPAWYTRTPEDRMALAESLQDVLASMRDDSVLSMASSCADGQSEVARVMSNGFADTNRGAWFTAHSEVTLQDEGGKRPEGYSFYGARHLSDLPDPERVASDALQSARERVGAGPIASGTYGLILKNRYAGRILGLLGGPLSGANLFEQRSCLTDRLGTRIGSPLLHIMDDPSVPRGLASRPWDGDGLRATPRLIVEDGILRNYYINVYYGRKLGMPATTGSRSNWVVRPGADSYDTIAKGFDRAILVTGFLGGNSNGTTGDFSLGVSGMLLENGVPVRPVAEMNISGNITDFYQKLSAVGDDPWRYSSIVTPTLAFADVQFSGR